MFIGAKPRLKVAATANPVSSFGSIPWRHRAVVFVEQYRDTIDFLEVVACIDARSGAEQEAS